MNSGQLITYASILRYSFREPEMPLTSKHNMQVTAYDNKPDVIQLFYGSLNMQGNT
jgi:hypothetical protein